MPDDGSFNDLARLAIYNAGLGRCAGCGRSQLTAQHRRARGMGGTTRLSIGHPANGVPLCGDGTRGCHGWTERNPHAALWLGWRLAPHQDALGSPWWCRPWKSWLQWVEVDGCPGVDFLFGDLGDLDNLPTRQAAVDLLNLQRNVASVRM